MSSEDLSSSSTQDAASEMDPVKALDFNPSSMPGISSALMRAAVNRMGGGGGGGYGASGYGGGGNMTLEIIALLLGLAFLTRILGDIINRIRAGRSLERSFEEDMNILTRNVLSALKTVETSMGGGRDDLDARNT